MKSLKRYDKPRILVDKEVEWLDKLKSKGTLRPDPTKYGNPKVLEALMTISHSKCYYCETLLKGIPSEIDHYIEVAYDIEKSYEWENLYLSCQNCNDKISHSAIPVTDALNPFIDSDDEIAKHLLFEDEKVEPKDNSIKGEITIKKFKLGSKHLDYLRLRELQKFNKEYRKIQKAKDADGRKINDSEVKTLENFASPTKPYSLMFKYLLAEVL